MTAVVLETLLDDAVVPTVGCDGLDRVAWRDEAGRVHVAPAEAGLLEAGLWTVRPVWDGVQYPNRAARYGLYYWAGTGEHVPFFSARELNALVGLDQAGQVRRVAARPVRFVFHAGCPVGYHDPVFLALRTTGDQVVHDLAPTGGSTVGEGPVEAARVCARIGWRHEVLPDPDPVLVANRGFLRPARLRRAHPGEDRHARVMGVFDGGRPLGEGAAMVDRRHPALAMPAIRHLIWHRRLSVDLGVLLDVDTVAVSDRQVRPCCG